MRLFAASVWLTTALPFLLFCSHVHADVLAKGVESRIINGLDTNPTEHEYFVALLKKYQWANGYNYYTFCGGSYLGNGTIVTAAHCVDGSVSTPVYVLVGNNSADMANEYCLAGGDINDNDYCRDGAADGYEPSGWVMYTGAESNLYLVTMGDFIIHQRYGNLPNGGIANDIALLQLDSAPSNAALVLPTSDQFNALARSAVANSVMVIGHGDTISDNDQDTFEASPQLLEARLTPKTDVFCSSLWADYDGSQMVCAGDTDFDIQDSCQGDSGGPLFDPATGILLGIVSFGPSKCADPDTPYAVYTDVYQYIDWIESNGTVYDPPLAFDDGENIIRLDNSAGSLGWLSLILLPLFLIRTKR